MHHRAENCTPVGLIAQPVLSPSPLMPPNAHRGGLEKGVRTPCGVWAAPSGHRGYFQGPLGAFLSYLSFPLVPWRGVLSRAGDKAGGRRLLPRLTPGGRNRAHCLPKPVFRNQPCLPSCPQALLMKMPLEKRRVFWVTMKLSIKSQTQG